MSVVSRASLLSTLCVAACVALAGCETTPAHVPSTETTVDNHSKLRAAGIRPVAVGAFVPLAGGSELLAADLRDTLRAELQGAGVFNEGSDALVSASEVTGRFDRLGGQLAARFVVTVAGGRVVYDRELRTSSPWTSAPDLGRQQAALHNKLVGLLFTDPGFRNAVRR